MTGRSAGLVSLVAGLAIAGCAQQPTTATPPPLASQPTVGQEVAAVAQNKVTVTFADGSSQLSPEAGRQLDVAARLFRDVNPVRMYSIGYSDARGDEFSNIVLSARRARAVKEGLVARGIPADRLFIQALGESEPVDSSDPLARENRRVTVMWRLI